MRTDGGTGDQAEYPVSGERQPDDYADLAQLFATAEADAASEHRHRSSPEVTVTTLRKRKRRRIIAGIATLAVAAIIGTYLSLVFTAPLANATIEVRDAAVESPEAAVIAVPEGVVSAVSVSGAEAFDGTAGVDGVLASSGGNDPRPIASITKLIAALVILEAKPLAAGESGPGITFTEADEDLYDHYYVLGATIQPLEGGSTMTERDALEFMLIPSATNYAEAVTRWAFGSNDAFRQAAAAWLAARGFTGTTIVEPTGLDPRNTSTPTELIAIARLALAHPVLAEIVAMRSTDVPGTKSAPNTNSLLGVEGVTGIKTGTLDEAGSCLLFSATMNAGSGSPISVVGVVLASESRRSAQVEAERLLESIRAGFHHVPVVGKGDSVATLTTPWGEQANVVAQAGAAVLTWSDMPISVEIEIDPVSTAAAGTRVATATYASGEQTQSVELLLASAIEAPDGWWRITHPTELFAAR